MVKCQNCGFESEGEICSFCGAEIVEIQEEAAAPKRRTLPDNAEVQTEDVKTQKPKKNIKKILLAVLIVVLSAAVVSASSVAIYSSVLKNDKSIFYKINQTVDCGDFSITLKEVKTPEFYFEYYPRISYELVFDFHNKTGDAVTIESYDISGLFFDDYDDLYKYLYYYDDMVTDYVSSVEIPAWSSIEISQKVLYEDDPYDSLIYEDSNDSLDDVITVKNSVGEKYMYKKEGLQSLKDNSPDSFYLVLCANVKDADYESKYAQFCIEPDRDAIVIPDVETVVFEDGNTE